MLIPLFVAAARLAPSRAAVAGLAWSVVATLCVGSWLPETIARFFEIPAALGWLALAGIALATVGVPSAALCAWISWSVRAGAAGPLALGAAFGLAEVARANGWPPLPWAILGTGALPESFVQAADAVGAHGLSILVAASNAALAAVFVPQLRTRRAALEAVAVAGLCAAAFAHGREQLARDFGDGAPLSVAVVQPGLAPGHAGRARSGRAVLHEPALELTRAVQGRGHDLVVWPEHATQAYLRERTPESETVRALSRELDGDLLLGGPHWRFAEPEPRYFTSATGTRPATSRAVDRTRSADRARGWERSCARSSPSRPWRASSRATAPRSSRTPPTTPGSRPSPPSTCCASRACARSRTAGRSCARPPPASPP